MSHIKTIDFHDSKVPSGQPTPLAIDYEADLDGEPITLEVLVSGVSIMPPRVTARRGANKDTFQVVLTRASPQNRTVLVEATIMIDPDHGSSAFDNIDVV